MGSIVVFDFKPFTTLRENCLLTYHISPFGGDEREGAGVENYFFNSLLEFFLDYVDRLSLRFVIGTREHLAQQSDTHKLYSDDYQQNRQ